MSNEVKEAVAPMCPAAGEVLTLLLVEQKRTNVLLEALLAAANEEARANSACAAHLL